MRKITFGLAGIFAMLLIGCGGGDSIVEEVVNNGNPAEVEQPAENEATENSLADGPPMLPEDANN